MFDETPKGLPLAEKLADQWSAEQQRLADAVRRCRSAGWNAVFSSKKLRRDLLVIGNTLGNPLQGFLHMQCPTNQELFLLASVFEALPKWMYSHSGLDKFLPELAFATMQDAEKAAKKMNSQREKEAILRQSKKQQDDERMAKKTADEDACACVDDMQCIGQYLNEFKGLTNVTWGIEDGGSTGEAILIIRPHDPHSPCQIGWVSLSFGSCSGCDAMEAASSSKERQLVAERIISTAHWYENAQRMRQKLVDFDWEGLETWVGSRLRRALVAKANLLADTPATNPLQQLR